MDSSRKAYYAEGRYRCQITDQGLTTAKTGNLQVALKFRVLRGTQPQQELEQQYERRMWLTATPNTLDFLVPKLVSVGYDRDGLSFIDLANPRHCDLRGNEFDAYCQHEDKGGDPEEKWNISNGESKPMELKAPDAKALRNMDMLFARARKNLGQATPAKAGPQPVPSNNQEATAEDRVPF